MKDLKISDLFEMQKKLWEQNKEKWAPMEPSYARNFLLFMIEEMGESIAIIKKKGDDEIMNNKLVRNHFIEEMGDIMMYYFDTLLRYKVTPEEFNKIYLKKHLTNLKRDYNYK